MGTCTSQENQMTLVRTYSLKVVEGSQRVVPECRHVHDQVQPEVSRPKQGKWKRRTSNKELIALQLPAGYRQSFIFSQFRRKIRSLMEIRISFVVAKYFYVLYTVNRSLGTTTRDQCSGSVTYWYRYGSGCDPDPYLWLTDSDADPAPDPALFVSDLQDRVPK